MGWRSADSFFHIVDLSALLCPSCFALNWILKRQFKLHKESKVSEFTWVEIFVWIYEESRYNSKVNFCLKMIWLWMLFWDFIFLQTNYPLLVTRKCAFFDVIQVLIHVNTAKRCFRDWQTICINNRKLKRNNKFHWLLLLFSVRKWLRCLFDFPKRNFIASYLSNQQISRAGCTVM